MAGTSAQLLSKCQAANHKLYFDVLLFGNNYSVPKMLAYLLLVQKKMILKSMLHNSPEPIKVFCNVNGLVSLRGVTSCWPEWTPDSSQGTYYLLSAH